MVFSQLCFSLTFDPTRNEAMRYTFISFFAHSCELSPLRNVLDIVIIFVWTPDVTHAFEAIRRHSETDMKSIRTAVFFKYFIFVRSLFSWFAYLFSLTFLRNSTSSISAFISFISSHFSITNSTLSGW